MEIYSRVYIYFGAPAVDRISYFKEPFWDILDVSMIEELSPAATSADTAPGSKNIYPFVRKLFFISCIILFFILIIFLIYYNGKSIYDNGI